MNFKVGMSITLFANVIFAISQWLIISGLNYSGNTSTVGQYAYSLALAGFFLTVGNFGLRPYLLSSAISQEEIPYVIHARVVTSTLSLILLILYSYFFVGSVYLYLIAIMGVMKLIESFSDICHGYFQRQLKIIEIAKSRIARSVLSPLLFFGLFTLSGNLVLASAGLVASLLIAFLFLDKKVLFVEKMKVELLGGVKVIPHIIKKSFPMGVASVLSVLLLSIPLFVLKKHTTDQDVGFYASIFYFVAAGSLILQSALQVVSPQLTLKINNKETLKVKSIIRRSYLMATFFGVVGLLLAVILGESILTLLYGNNFIAFKNTLIIAAGANLFFALQAVGGIALTSFGVFKYQMICMICTVPIGYFSSEYFVVNYGVDGALYSGTLCAFVISTSFIIRLIYELSKHEKN